MRMWVAAVTPTWMTARRWSQRPPETRKQGGANVEPSAKMIAMIDTLKEWEVTGDKTIVFSQCESCLHL